MNPLAGLATPFARATLFSLGLAWLGLTGTAFANEHEPTELSAESAGHGEHGQHGLDPKRLLFQFINFGLLVAIVGFAGGKAINKTLAARHDQLKKDLDEASAARADAQARLKEQEARLANLESEVARLLAAIKDEAAQEEQRLLASAEEKARRIQDETRFLVDQQVKEAERNFRQEVANASARIAEEIVRRSVKGDDELRLQQSFISDVESGASN
jgi:F-type H+-transporting ATPase subunit b